MHSLSPFLSYRFNDEPNIIQVLVSFVTESGLGSEILLTGIEHILESSLSQQLTIQISVRGLIRFGKHIIHV